MKRVYLIRKFVVASSVKEAMKLDKTTPPDEIILKGEVDQDEGKAEEVCIPIGFRVKKAK